MNEKEKNKIIDQLLILDLFSLICGYYFIDTINEFIKQDQWWYDLLVMLIVICEMTYNWIQLLNYKNKIPKLVFILTGVTISAIFAGIYFSRFWMNIHANQSHTTSLMFTMGWGALLVVMNLVLWFRYKKNN